MLRCFRLDKLAEIGFCNAAEGAAELALNNSPLIYYPERCHDGSGTPISILFMSTVNSNLSGLSSICMTKSMLRSLTLRQPILPLSNLYLLTLY